MVKVVIDGMVCEKPDQEEQAQEAEEEAQMRTCPRDPRFQQQNVTKWCYTMFVDFHRCSHYFGPDHKHCQYFKNCYQILCPNSWVNNWVDQIKKGTFPRDLTKEMGQ